MRIPYRGAGIGLVKDGCLLMGRRSDRPFYGKWAVPGGGRDRTDPDELFTAKREMKEEMSVDFDSLDSRYICRWTLDVPFFRWTTFFYEIGSSDLDIRLAPDEFSEYEWVPLDRLTGKGERTKKDLRPFVRSEVRCLLGNLK